MGWVDPCSATTATDCLPFPLLTHPSSLPPLLPPCLQMLGKILDRSHLVRNLSAKDSERPYPESGVGYEVVAQIDGSGLLKGVE